jgi:hypothetical protein
MASLSEKAEKPGRGYFFRDRPSEKFAVEP